MKANRNLLMLTYKGHTIFRAKHQGSEWALWSPATGEVIWNKNLAALTSLIDREEHV